MKKKSNIKKKGGSSIVSNIIGDKPGPFIPENLQLESEKGNKDVILNKYKNIKEDAEKDYIIKKDSYYNEEENRIKTSERFITFLSKIVGPSIYALFNFFSYLYENVLSKVLRYIRKFVIFIKDCFVSFIYNIGYIFNNITKARGVILVVIIFIIIIIIIISFFYGGNLPNPFSGNNIYKSTDGLIISYKDLKNDSPFAILANQLQNIIPVPDEYVNQLNKFKNDFYGFFGKDIINDNIDTTLRGTITTGRYDGIYNVANNINITDKNIYSTIKPKNSIQININLNDYANIDYQNLPTALKALTKYNIDNYKINIPLSSNQSNMYYYDIDNANYHNKTDNTYVKPINTGEYKIFNTSNIIDTNIKTIFNINQVPIDKFLFSNKDNLNKQILETKLFNYDDTSGKYIYPTSYIDKILNKIV
jgi:hypothetical protein